jgi:hypothetical protein
MVIEARPMVGTDGKMQWGVRSQCTVHGDTDGSGEVKLLVIKQGRSSAQSLGEIESRMLPIQQAGRPIMLSYIATDCQHVCRLYGRTLNVHALHVEEPPPRLFSQR